VSDMTHQIQNEPQRRTWSSEIVCARRENRTSEPLAVPCLKAMALSDASPSELAFEQTAGLGNFLQRPDNVGTH
jgi:hypothetical protein